MAVSIIINLAPSIVGADSSHKGGGDMHRPSNLIEAGRQHVKGKQEQLELFRILGRR